jgi:hypothetical protein
MARPFLFHRTRHPSSGHGGQIVLFSPMRRVVAITKEFDHAKIDPFLCTSRSSYPSPFVLANYDEIVPPDSPSFVAGAVYGVLPYYHVVRSL